METKILKSLAKAAGAALVPVSMAVSSCTAEPDESNMYTFTGQTIESFIQANDSAFSDFHYIMTRCGYDRVLASYGTYTLFLPNNNSVQKYIDSLYNDALNVDLPHNGMTENSLEGLTDSLCEDIVEFHLLGTTVNTIDMGTTGTVLNTLLGRQINATLSTDDGSVLLNDGAKVTAADNEAVNGVVHVINSVIPRSNRTVDDELSKAEGFAIFSEALVLTGLADSLTAKEKTGVTYTTPTEKLRDEPLYVPLSCKLGFTLFAESDSTFRKNGIHNIDDLVEKCIEWYGASATGTGIGDGRSETQGWYDYYRNNNIEVSTGDDYTNSANVLNMFVRYHILKAALNRDALALYFNVWEQDGYNGDTYDYYETMLPKTIMKVWRQRSSDRYSINRYIRNNTLTDAVESMGNAIDHTEVYPGVTIDVDNIMQPLNGYIYPIEDILLYDYKVPTGVLNERMRVDVLTMLPEIMNNGFRGMRKAEVVALNSNDTDTERIQFPYNFFENCVVYNGDLSRIAMNVLADEGENSFLLYRGDSFQGTGTYDFAIKLPPVPDGTYELRVAATNFGYTERNAGSMCQFYLGTSSDRSSMQPIDLPIDLRMPTSATDARVAAIGYEDINDQDNFPDAYADRGLASDKVMRTHGYMRDALSIVKEYHSDHTYKPRKFVARYIAYQFRKILTTQNFEQRDYWLRLKTVLPEDKFGKWQLDYIEFVPTNVYDSQLYMEDMY